MNNEQFIHCLLFITIQWIQNPLEINKLLFIVRYSLFISHLSTPGTIGKLSLPSSLTL